MLLGGSGFVVRLARLAFYPGDEFSRGVGEVLDGVCGRHRRIIRMEWTVRGKDSP